MGYTDTDRAEAVELALTHGVHEAAHRTGASASSISRWLTPEQRHQMAQRTTEKTRAATEAATAKLQLERNELRSTLLANANRMLERMTEPEVDYRGNVARQVEFDEASPSSCKAFATAAAILIDKLRLELGEVTDRTERRTVDEVSAEVERLAEQLAAHD